MNNLTVPAILFSQLQNSGERPLPLPILITHYLLLQPATTVASHPPSAACPLHPLTSLACHWHPAVRWLPVRMAVQPAGRTGGRAQSSEAHRWTRGTAGAGGGQRWSGRTTWRHREVSGGRETGRSEDTVKHEHGTLGTRLQGPTRCSFLLLHCCRARNISMHIAIDQVQPGNMNAAVQEYSPVAHTALL